MLFFNQAFAAGPSQEAIDALQGLQSVTQAGVSYPEYSTRFLDAKVKVDHYLSFTEATRDAQQPQQRRDEIKTAILNYEFVYQGWGSELRSLTPDVSNLRPQRNLTITQILSGMVARSPQCPGVTSFLSTLLPRNGKRLHLWEKLRNGDRVLAQYKALGWTCASEQVDLVLKEAN